MRTRCKICGITQLTDAQHAVACGADALGFVFYPPSPRAVTPATARAIVDQLPPFVTCVALFVDETVDVVSDTIAQVRPSLLQFHGQESADFCRQFGLPYLKAVRFQAGVTDLLALAQEYADACGLLVDAFVPGMVGGTGQTFDWTHLPPNLSLPLVLSGGFDPENIAAALQTVRPYAVDVSSGVEASKGKKDPAKVAAFLRACHATL